MEWDISYMELITWISQHNADVQPVTGWGQGMEYEFECEHDYLAFSLTFSRYTITKESRYEIQDK